MKYTTILAAAGLSLHSTTLAAPLAEYARAARGLLGLNAPVLSGGDSTAHCNHDGLVDINTPVFGNRRKRHGGLFGGGGGGGHDGGTILDLNLPFLSGGKSTQKCETDDLIELDLPILSGREEN